MTTAKTMNKGVLKIDGSFLRKKADIGLPLSLP
jgi:hypothetical protein